MKGYRWIAAAVVLLLSVGGCSVPSPNVAASVAGRTISAHQVEQLNTVVARVVQQTPAETRSTVLTWLIRGELARAAAPKRGVADLQGQRRSIIATKPLLQFLASDPSTAGLADDMADSLAFAGAVGGDDNFAAAVADVPLTVNPRYGAWDRSQALIATSGSLSLPFTPAATATPVPTASPSR